MSTSNSDTKLELPKRKRHPDDGELDITPMIDVTFLLMSFFVVVSNMDPQAAMGLPKASYGETVPEKNCVTLLVAVPETGTGFTIFKGRSIKEEARIPDAEPEVLEMEIGDFVDTEFSRFPEKTAVLIKAEGDLTTRTVEMIKRGVSRSELAKTRKLYIGVADE